MFNVGQKITTTRMPADSAFTTVTGTVRSVRADGRISLVATEGTLRGGKPGAWRGECYMMAAAGDVRAA